MLFFKYTCQYEAQIKEDAEDDLPDAPCEITLQTKSKPVLRKRERDFDPIIEDLTKQCQIISRSQPKDTYCFLSKFSIKEFCICAICDLAVSDSGKMDEIISEILKPVNIKITSQTRKELLLKELKNELDNATDEEFIISPRTAQKTFNLDFNSESYFCEQTLSQENITLDEALKICEHLCVDDSVAEEIKRIFQPSNGTFGVPVHYIVNSTNQKYNDQVCCLIAKCLRQNGRCLRDKFGIFNLSSRVLSRPFFEDKLDLKKMFSFEQGGIVVIKSAFDVGQDKRYADELYDLIDLCVCLSSIANDTTIIVCGGGASPSHLKFYKEELKDLLFVDLNEPVLFDDNAKKYLSNLAYQNSIEIHDDLVESIQPNKGYRMRELDKTFKLWLDKYVKTVQFPQYSFLVKKTMTEEQPKPQGDAFEELNSLIGLENAKKVVKDYINYAKLQKFCDISGRKHVNVCRHMSFLGNPGTAKTTVARLIARIMKENGLLSNGELIEVGRADIVSRYVGGTAPQVKAMFDRARGNVLFIDEAYSLYDGKEGLFGDEAINAIVQEMENNRDDMVVIFAGYKKEMQAFLDRNSGLRSRIGFEIDFPDYSSDELLKIAHYQAQNMGFDISLCQDKLKSIIESGKIHPNFGNGRFVRNILEKARIRQATRLVSSGELDGEHVDSISPHDLEEPILKEEKIELGFRA